MILNLLGLRHGTDKSDRVHGYLHFYERQLAHLRDQGPLRVLELGIGTGDSLRMWRDYFLNAQIVGFDHNEDCRKYQGDRIIIEIGEQSDENALLRVAKEYGPFHLIVDDCGHDGPLQIASHKLLLPYVRSTGLYILEDIGADVAQRYMIDMALGVLKGDHQHIESIAFFRDTSVTRMK